MPNRLIDETSPYLLQHAHNPVDWYPWGPEALERAKQEDKPILLSVGYSACHWCHVMERESFEDPEIAAKMNELFVSIKVDREERPDVDSIYMRALVSMEGRGGWPLNVFLMPSGAPFYGGTYYPNEDRGRMLAWPRVLDAVADAYHNKPQMVEDNALTLAASLRAAAQTGAADEPISADVARLQGALGAGDQRKLGAYLDAVRDVERRIEVAEAQGDREVPLVERPIGVPADFADHASLMYDLQVLAHQTDRTRVTTFMSGHELSGRTYPEIGVPDAHHPLSHHRGVPDALAKLTKINRYHVGLFAAFVEKLRATPDGDGSLLDHMVLMYGAGMSDSNAHSPYNLPIVLLGGGAGTLRGGRHVSFDERDRTPLANLHVTLLDKLGAPVERIGDSTGPLPTLLAGHGADRLSEI